MKKIIGIVMVLLMLMSVTGAWAGNAKDTQTGGEKVKVIIGYVDKPNQADEDVIRGHGGKTKYTYHIINAKAVEIPERAIDRIKKNPRVKYVEEDAEVYALDAELDNSWGVKHIGAGVVHDGGNTGAGVNVSIIDTGIDYTHTDLDANYKGGYDFVNNDNDPMDDAGHGTHCAGIVAAEDNDIGVIGVAPEAYLYGVKVLDSGGSGSYSNVAAGIEWSIENEMQVISMSLGGSFDSQTLHDACDAAYAAGIVVVAAAGNDGIPPGRGDNVGYPARYSSVIAVAATDSDDNRASFSSTGPDVELAAPGVSIYSTVRGGGYDTKSGTSMACPHVAGTAALVMIAYPSWTNENIRLQLRNTADDLGPAGKDEKYGYGLVDADEAALPSDTTPPAKVTGLTIATVSCNQLDLSWDANEETDLKHYNVYRSITSGESYELIASPSTFTYSDIGLTALTDYYYVVSAVDNSGNEGEASDEASGTTSADNLGPVTSNVVADPNPTNGATSVTLTADIDDSTTGNSNIVAAEYFVGSVGTDGDGIPMSASDDTFDSPTEAVTASIDVSSLTAGLHTLYVHGKDVEGNWGTTESVVLDVTEEPSNEMHASIEMSPGSRSAGRNTFVWAVAAVTIVDANGNPVKGATVYGTWSGATSDSDSGVTDTSGSVSLESDSVKNPPSETTFTFTVDGVTHADLTWDLESTSGSITV